jgi:GNAT superfamily N-acetyltransferase
MAAPVRIRLAKPGENVALTRLAMRSKAYWAYDADFMVRAAPELTVRPEWIEAGFVLVAEEEGQAIGVAGLEIADGGNLEVSVFFVAPERIGSGLGRSFFEALAAKARELMHETSPQAALTILSDPNAEAFYLRMGARRIGEEVAVTGRTLPLLSYRLRADVDATQPLSQPSIARLRVMPQW